MVRAADGVLVVLDHDQRVALRLELLQRVEQDPVVARVQADRGLVEDVAHAAQVGAELRGEADALRLAARERRRRAVERRGRRARPRSRKPRRERSSATMSRAISRFAALQLDAREQRRERFDRQRGELGDRAALPAHRERLAVEALALARGAGLVDLQPFDPGVEHVVLGAGARALLVPFDLVELRGRCRSTAAHQPCLELKENSRGSSSAKLRPQEGQARLVENTLRCRLPRRATCDARPCRSRAPLPNSTRSSTAHSASLSATTRSVGDRQLDRVLLEAVDARPLPVGRNSPSTRRCAVALAARPLREIGVVALAVRRPAARAAPIVWPLYSRSRRAAIASSLCGSIGTSQSGQCCVPSLTNSRRRKW